MLSELDRYGGTTPDFFEQINLRLAQSVTARNALGRDPNDGVREIATMLYCEIHPSGRFRFVNFGHPPPLIFCSKSQKFRAIDKDRMAQFPPLGLEIPEDHPDRNKYFSMTFRKKHMNSSDVEELTLMDKGDIFFLYTDGVYDGSDAQSRLQIEQVIRDHKDETAKGICNAVLVCAKQDDYLEQILKQTGIDDKTVFIIKRT
jgi:serine phosphatase RsbU (regulator of sigma subunit)